VSVLDADGVSLMRIEITRGVALVDADDLPDVYTGNLIAVFGVVPRR